MTVGARLEPAGAYWPEFVSAGIPLDPCHLSLLPRRPILTSWCHRRSTAACRSKLQDQICWSYDQETKVWWLEAETGIITPLNKAILLLDGKNTGQWLLGLDEYRTCYGQLTGCYFVWAFLEQEKPS